MTLTRVRGANATDERGAEDRSEPGYNSAENKGLTPELSRAAKRRRLE